MGLATDVQAITPGSLMSLYVLDLNPIGQAVVFRFYAGLEVNYGQVTYQGHEYTPWPIKATGFAKATNGPFPRPELALSNVTGYFSAQIRTYDDLVGVKVQRIRTMGKYLDNGVSPDTAAFAVDTYFINRRKTETIEAIAFELTSALDLANKKLPNRVMIANTCTWAYKGAECGWPGTNANLWFDRNGTAVGSSASDVCGKKVSDCKLRYGSTAELPYGGFPGMGRT